MHAGYPAVYMENDMSNIDKMVGRFLGWKLPDDFGPDRADPESPRLDEDRVLISLARPL